MVVISGKVCLPVHGWNDWKLLIDRHTEGNINTNEQFQTNVRLQNCENYSSTKLFQISVFKIP